MQSLKGLGKIPVGLCGFENAGRFAPLCYHPDMLCFRLEENKWIFYEGIYEKNKNIIDGLGLDVTLAPDPLSPDYPHDVGLCAAMFGRFLICNAKHTNQKILEYAARTQKKLIDVRQGYAKCSVCIVGENAIMTADLGIYKKALQNKVEALLVGSGHIELARYDYGFIGGCSGLLDAHTLAFFGDITKHPDCEKMERFCGRFGVKLISLSKEKLCDYGGIIAL